MRGKLLKVAVLLAVLLTVVLVSAQTNGQSTRKQISNAFNERAPQQALYLDYKGVRLGMTPAEVRSKLGQSGMRIDEQELFVFNDHETAQIAYDTANKVKSISVDYLGGLGAPDYRNVVGPDVNVKPDGSMYKIIRYEQMGFWVSYNRTANSSVVMVTITIAKFM